MGWLDEPVTTLAFCWRLERRDGVGIGLTSHDRDVVIDGNVYRAAPGMVPSAIRRGDGSDPDSLDVTGALASPAIGEADLLAGRWDGARVAILAVDWSDPANRISLGEGTIGAVETADGRFTAELRGAAALLDRPFSEETSPECRAELGDKRCRVVMAERRGLARVISSSDEDVVVDIAEPVADGWGGGRLRWLGGANAGLEAAIALSEGDTVTLRTPPRFVPQAGDRVELIEGCDKSVMTCAARFGNVANFRGEPYLPGVDLLTRYPGL